MAVSGQHWSSGEIRSLAQNQKAVSAYFTGKRILPFGFAEQRCPADWFNQRGYIYNLLGHVG